MLRQLEQLWGQKRAGKVNPGRSLKNIIESLERTLANWFIFLRLSVFTCTRAVIMHCGLILGINETTPVKWLHAEDHVSFHCRIIFYINSWRNFLRWVLKKKKAHDISIAQIYSKKRKKSASRGQAQRNCDSCHSQWLNLNTTWQF